MYYFTEWFETPPELNTKVYVSDLPLDITQDEFTEVMSKCGMIFRDPQTNKMRVKLYTEKDGQLKGDGLCHYIKVSLTFLYCYFECRSVFGFFFLKKSMIEKKIMGLTEGLLTKK